MILRLFFFFNILNRVPEKQKSSWKVKAELNFLPWIQMHRLDFLQGSVLFSFMLILLRWKTTYRNFSFLFLKKLDFSGIEPEVKPFEEKFGKKILVKCNDLSFNLQSCVAENEEGPTTNVNNSSNYFLLIW